jgi:hypothetical protein
VPLGGARRRVGGDRRRRRASARVVCALAPVGVSQPDAAHRGGLRGSPSPGVAVRHCRVAEGLSKPVPERRRACRPVLPGGRRSGGRRGSTPGGLPQRADHCHRHERHGDRGHSELTKPHLPEPGAEAPFSRSAETEARPLPAGSRRRPRLRVTNRVTRVGRCLDGVVQRTRVLAPEGIGRRRELVGGRIRRMLALRRCRTDGHEFLQGPNPLAGEADDVVAPFGWRAVAPRRVRVFRIPIARFHEVCRPFVERPRPVRLLGEVVYRLNWFQFVSIREGRDEPE